MLEASPNVTIIDYGIGNLRSMEKALEAVGANVLRTDDPEAILASERVVLPGVGAFGACADEIHLRRLEPVIHKYLATGRPFLGVCVGMQLLFTLSEEMGSHPGLDILPGKVVRFAEGATDELGERLKVPHMGWNILTDRAASPLLAGLPDEAYFYFVHSYHALAEKPEDVLARSPYGGHFPAVVGRGNVYGVQFHPEKSHTNGLQVLRNFLSLAN